MSAPARDNNEPVNGADLLKQLWDISDEKRPREVPPSDVNTNIYSLPPTSRRIPQRPRPRK